VGHFKPKKKNWLNFDLRDPDIKVQAWDIFVIFRNNLNGFWHFYQGTSPPP
jgi:hypothetical protein